MVHFLALAILSSFSGLGVSSWGKTLSVGDQAFKQRSDRYKAVFALNWYRKHQYDNPTDTSAAWKLSMACQYVAFYIEKSPEERIDLYWEGKEVARKATEQDPTCGPCHFWAAVNMALYGESVGVLKMLFTLSDVKSHLYQAVEHSPVFAFGGAYRILGIIYQKLPGILGGSNDEAKKLFNKAINVSPENPLNYLFLAKLLSTEYSEKKEALGVVRHGLSQPHPASHQVESIEARKELQALLTSLS